MRIISATVAAALTAATFATPVFAQAEGIPLAQVERKYRTMNEVHILKCDYDGNRLFTRTEMICVQSIYRSLYVERR